MDNLKPIGTIPIPTIHGAIEIPVYPQVPEGWELIKGAQAAPNGYAWINNGKNRFSTTEEYKHAFVLSSAIPKDTKQVNKHILESRANNQKPKINKAEQAKGGLSNKIIKDDQKTPYAIQTLARHQMIHKIYSDVLMDAQICAIEGWDVKEYATMLYDAIKVLPRHKKEGDY